MRSAAIFLTAGLILVGCSPTLQGSAGSELNHNPIEQLSTEVGLPPELAPDESFELVFESTIEHTFARSLSVPIRPVALFYEGKLFFLVFN